MGVWGESWILLSEWQKGLIEGLISVRVEPSGNTGVKPTPAVSGFFYNRRCRLGVARNTDLAGVGQFTLSGISAGVGWSEWACPSVSVPAGVALRATPAVLVGPRQV
eukprot:315392-Prorocentrum_minimum.AAC.3